MLALLPSDYAGLLSMSTLLCFLLWICRGVGFINYGDPDAAARAVAAMNGMPVGGDKRLFVSLQTHRSGGSTGGR